VERVPRYEFPTLYDEFPVGPDRFWFPFYPYWIDQTVDLNVDIPFEEQRYFQNQSGLLGVAHPLLFETEDDTDHSIKIVDYLQVVTEKQLIRTSTLCKFVKFANLSMRGTLEEILKMLQLGSKQVFSLKWFVACLLKEFSKVILFGTDSFASPHTEFERNILSHSSLIKLLEIFDLHEGLESMEDYIPERSVCYCSTYGFLSHCAQSTHFGYYMNKQHMWSGNAITKGLAWLSVDGRIEIDNQYFPMPHPNHRVFRSTGAFAGKLIDGSL
jgi:hypothetical protein